MKRFLLGLSLAAAFIAAAGSPASAAPINVGLELSLLVDVSGSVDGNEFLLQRNGYVAAFQSAAVQNAIAQVPGGIAVNFIYWSGAGQQQQAVGWTHITNAAQANAFAAAIGATSRPFSGLTAPGSAINFAVPLFASNDFISNRQVIDVSGDGAENDGANTATARNAALLAGIDTINGLPILGETGLLTWYQNNIQGGVGSFTLPATFDTFSQTVQEKIEREIVEAVIPEPASMLLWGGLVLGAGVVGVRKWRRQGSPSAAA